MFFGSKDPLGDKIFSQFPYLPINDELILRDVQMIDAPEYYEYLNAPGVVEFIPDSCLPSSAEGAKKELQCLRDLHNRRRSVYWTIARREDNTMIGACGFEVWNRFHRRLEIAYDLNPAYWRRGIATQAISTIISYGFATMEAKRIEAYIKPDNTASAGLLTKLGFQKEATLRQYRYFKGDFIDIDLYALLASEWTV